MLDRASLERLSRTPEKNAPMLNVALAEEGTASVLLALARCPAVGPETLEVIAGRIAHEGAEVGRDPDVPEESFVSPAGELDRLLISHSRTPGHARDEVLARHSAEAFFVLAAACHPGATLGAIEHAIDWNAASPLHDRLWLALIDEAMIPPLTMHEWAQDPSPLRREAMARISRDTALLAMLGCDRSRQVRRAVASNRFAAAERARLAADDRAPEVRARAASALTAHGDPVGEGGSVVETAKFAAALRAMATFGVLAPDVVRALSSDAEGLDEEGAMLAGIVLPRGELGMLLEKLVDLGLSRPCAMSAAAGMALRPKALPGSPVDLAGEAEAEWTEIAYETVKTLSRTTTADSRLTGKARLAAWAAEGLVGSSAVDFSSLAHCLSPGPLAADRMILARSAALRPSLVRDLCEAARHAAVVPAALIELGWADDTVSASLLVELAARIAKPKKRAEDLPEDEVDFDPTLRSLDVLENLVVAVTQRTSVSPRAALAVVALDARRVRYILSAMPQWKGRLSGGRLARILRQHAAALSAGQSQSRTKGAKVEGWTERVMHEIEFSIALSVGHITGAEAARRIQSGRQVIADGLTFTSGVEARAALEGAVSVSPILGWAAKHRTSDPSAFVVWLLAEKLDRERAPSLIASSIDTLATGKGVVAPSVCDALSAIERRRPGRLETVHPQSARGRATLASAIARAYRAVGGMRDERA